MTDHTPLILTVSVMAHASVAAWLLHRAVRDAAWDAALYVLKRVDQTNTRLKLLKEQLERLEAKIGPSPERKEDERDGSPGPGPARG
jgi:uncharacterized small protein (DUF1192 family)